MKSLKWIWKKLKKIPVLGWVFVGIAGLLTFAGGDWLKRHRTKKAIRAVEKKLEKEKEVRDAEREDRRRAAHDACPFDE